MNIKLLKVQDRAIVEKEEQEEDDEEDKQQIVSNTKSKPN